MFTFRPAHGTVMPMATSENPTLRECRDTLGLSQAVFAKLPGALFLKNSPIVYAANPSANV
jgi:hypothetical protein